MAMKVVIPRAAKGMIAAFDESPRESASLVIGSVGGELPFVD